MTVASTRATPLERRLVGDRDSPRRPELREAKRPRLEVRGLHRASARRRDTNGTGSARGTRREGEPRWRRIARVAWRRAAVAVVVVAAALAAERGLGALAPFPHARFDAFGASTVVEARDGTVLRVTTTPGGERILPVRLGDLSPHLVHALLAAEDRRFHEHAGIDVRAVARAVADTVCAGRVVSGASTLTMQLVRIAEPRDRSLGAKLVEVFRARQLERDLAKDEILARYLDLAPLGGTLRGFGAAAWTWCGKSVSDLAPHEAAALVAMLPAPTRRVPDRGGAELLAARNRVLDRMLAEGWLATGAHARAVAEPLGLARHPWPFRAAQACEVALAESGQPGPRLRTDIDTALQVRVEEIAHGNASPADGVAIVVVDRGTGGVAALAGARDGRSLPVNAATCPRAVGSTLKPFLWALAMDAGAAGPDARLLDEPLAFADWRPENFARDATGPVHAGDALVESRNLPAVRLLRAVGADRFRDVLRGLGLPVPATAMHLDAVLGTVEVSPLALARAWRRFADEPEVAGLSAASSRHVLDVLATRSPGATVLGTRAVAWKTGTSSNRRDAWSVGVTERHVIVVWTGRLDGRPDAGLVGARATARILAEVVAGL